jgi:predicted ABC-type ATPase
MIAGPNGSGKSTLIALLQDQNIPLGTYFNADDLARAEVERRGAELANLTKQEQTARRAELWVQASGRAQIAVRQLRDDALSGSQDYAFETVMSHPSHIEHFQAARLAGFRTRPFFVCTSHPVINVGRVANRVEHGGHDVPTERIVERYNRCLKLLPYAIEAADDVLVYDNSICNRPLRLLAAIVDTVLYHGEVKEVLQLDPMLADWSDLPAWWLKVLIRIKAIDPFADGPLL